MASSASLIHSALVEGIHVASLRKSAAAAESFRHPHGSHGASSGRSSGSSAASSAPPCAPPPVPYGSSSSPVRAAYSSLRSGRTAVAGIPTGAAAVLAHRDDLLSTSSLQRVASESDASGSSHWNRRNRQQQHPRRRRNQARFARTHHHHLDMVPDGTASSSRLSSASRAKVLAQGGELVESGLSFPCSSVYTSQLALDDNSFPLVAHSDSISVLSPLDRVASTAATSVATEEIPVPSAATVNILPAASDSSVGVASDNSKAPSGSSVSSVIRLTGMRSPHRSFKDALLSDVSAGLLSGCAPQLTPDGSGGTYMLKDATGESRVAVFKPMDEEPLAWNCPRGMPPSETGEGLKRGTRVGEGAYREVAAYLLDHPLHEGDAEGFAGVPPTALVRCHAGFFPSPTPGESPVTPLDLSPSSPPSSPQSAWVAAAAAAAAEGVVGKVGSLQQFVPAISNCEDMGPSRFPVGEVHKIAVLDMRLANTDRNGANILVQQVQQVPVSSTASENNNGASSAASSSTSFRLVPIDHGYCLPESWEDCTLEWLYWPQAKKPFADDARSYIARLDADADVATLREAGWALRPAAELVFKASTMLLKKGAGAGRTPFEIGSLMVRDDPDEPSEIEKMVAEAKGKVRCEGEEEEGEGDVVGSKAFWDVLSVGMDGYFGKGSL